MEVQVVNLNFQGVQPENEVQLPLQQSDFEGEGTPVIPNDKRSPLDGAFTKALNPDNKNDMEKLQDAINKANKVLKPSFRCFERSYHKGARRIMVKVMDMETKEVIREVPPEKFLDMVAGLIEMAGLMVDKIV